MPAAKQINKGRANVLAETSSFLTALFLFITHATLMDGNMYMTKLEKTQILHP